MTADDNREGPFAREDGIAVTNIEVASGDGRTVSLEDERGQGFPVVSNDEVSISDELLERAAA